MNLVDWIIVGIVGVSVLIGLYRGFIASVASMGGSLVSLGASYWLTPKLVEYLQQHTGLASTLETYLDARTRLDTTTAGQSVAGLSSGSISDILSKVGLPAPLDTLLKTNLENQVFNAGQNVGEYVRQTIVGAAMNVICFVVCFIVLMLLFHIIINLLKAIFKFPVLKQLNSVAGGAFGLLRGALICFVAFALLPLIQAMVPLEEVNTLINESTLAPMFNSTNLILSIMNGRL